MTYDPNIGLASDKMSCERQIQLAKMIADEESSKLRYLVANPSCSRYTQLADRAKEHDLTLGRSGIKMNNSFCRVLPQSSILQFPNNMCILSKQSGDK